jgi:ABC-type transport system involved in multi-copper enzyme maturation permease subunit
MPLGPVFTRELTSSARSARFHALRSACAIGQLAVFLAIARETAGSLALGSIAGVEFARRLFQNLLIAQGAAIVVLTPALVGGAIAEETQRRTLHELLTTELSSAEIVLGKLAARLALVGVLAATGLPLLLVSGFLGGIDPLLVAVAVAATLSTGFFLGSLSILASTQTRSVRGALNFTFTLALTWLILPGAIAVLLPRGGQAARAIFTGLGPINAWIAATSPFALWIDCLRGAIVGATALLERVVWMIALECVYGVLLTALAIVGLRPSFRAQLGGRRRSRSRSRADRHAPRRPPCGDDPMLWKELLLPRVPAFYRPLGLGVALILGGLLTWTTVGLAVPALCELMAVGYGVAPAGSARAAFHAYLRIVGTGVALVTLLGVASDAAAGLTGEREKETWISLIATPLSGTEIIRGKMLGAIGNTRHTAVVLLSLWIAGVVTGAVHPLGLFAVVVELAVLFWFTAALGTWISLRARHTVQALARVMGALLFCFGGSLLAALPVLSLRPLALTAAGPLLLAVSLASYGEIAGKPLPGGFDVLSDTAVAACWAGHGPEMGLAWGTSVVVWSLAAWSLTRSACRSFDACHDRPPQDSAAVELERRTGSGRVNAPPQPAPGAARRSRPSTAPVPRRREVHRGRRTGSATRTAGPG